MEYVTPMFENEGENVPMPPSGRFSVVIGMSPNPMVITLKPRTAPSPTVVAKPMALSEMPDPERYCVLAKRSSFWLMNAKPAALRKVPSRPSVMAMLVPAMPLDWAHGLIRSWPAPAEPARSGLPAKTAVVSIKHAVRAADARMVCCIFFIANSGSNQKLSKSVGRMMPNHLSVFSPMPGTSTWMM